MPTQEPGTAVSQEEEKNGFRTCEGNVFKSRFKKKLFAKVDYARIIDPSWPEYNEK